MGVIVFNEISNSNSLEQNLAEVINLDFVDEAKTKKYLINHPLLLSLRAEI